MKYENYDIRCRFCNKEATLDKIPSKESNYLLMKCHDCQYEFDIQISNLKSSNDVVSSIDFESICLNDGLLCITFSYAYNEFFISYYNNNNHTPCNLNKVNYKSYSLEQIHKLMTNYEKTFIL